MKSHLSFQMTQILQSLLRNKLTSRFCLSIGGKFSNRDYEALHFSSNSTFADAESETFVEITVRPVSAQVVSMRHNTMALPVGAFVIRLEEDDLLPWNLAKLFMWPKYPQLFVAASNPQITDWLEDTCSNSEYPALRRAVKLAVGSYMLPVGVRVNSSGEHCYEIATAASNIFESFSSVAYYPIGSYHQDTIPQSEFDVAGWA